jgi:hypothetical protein
MSLSEFNIIMKTWSDIVSDHPMFWSDMIGHLIILKRDIVSCHSTRNQNRNNYQKSKTICIMVTKLHNINDNLLSNSIHCYYMDRDEVRFYDCLADGIFVCMC